MNLRKKIKEIVLEYLMEQYNTQNDLYYHGSKSHIYNFTKSDPINRIGNVEGFYFTKNINIAKTYGDKITVVKLKILKPFILGKTPVSDKMISIFSNELYTQNPQIELDSDWVNDKSQYFKEKKRIPFTNMDGNSQQKIFKSEGYDSVIDGHEICVFDSYNIVVMQYL